MENDIKESGGNKGKSKPDFPLFRHRNGQWAKKVRQKLLYFGTDRELGLNK